MANEKEKLILVEKSSNGIATITLNRPQALNALSRDMLVTLAFTFTSLDEDPDVRVIILTGAGRAFSAGIVTSFPSSTLQIVSFPQAMACSKILEWKNSTRLSCSFLSTKKSRPSGLNFGSRAGFDSSCRCVPRWRKERGRRHAGANAEMPEAHHRCH